MKTLLRVGIVVVLCLLALAGLWLHNRSLRLVNRVQTLEACQRELNQEACSLRAEVNRLACYSRLESLWVAAGRPGPEESQTAGQPDRQTVGQTAGDSTAPCQAALSQAVPVGAN